MESFGGFGFDRHGREWVFIYLFHFQFIKRLHYYKRGHRFAGIKFVNKDASHPRTKDQRNFIEYELATTSRNVWVGGGIKMSL